MTGPPAMVRLAPGLMLGCMLLSLSGGSAIAAGVLNPSQQAREDFWVPDGPVSAMVHTNGVLYIGGTFDYVSPVSETGHAFERFSGATLPDFPKFSGAIKALLPDNAGGWFVGGQFTAAGDRAITNLAHINSDLTVDASWNPSPDGPVLALAMDGQRLFVGGSFATIAGQPHSMIAALNPTNGAGFPWRADASSSFGNGSVNALALGPGTLYAAGYFNSINSQTREHIGAMDSSTGEVTPWSPNGPTFVESDSRIDALALSGSILYVGGTFGTIGSLQTNRLTRRAAAALDVTQTNSSVTSWNPDANGPVTAIAVSCGIVYMAGNFTEVGGVPRARLAAVDINTGLPLPWDPQANSDVLSLVSAGNTIYAGGKFTQVGGQPRDFIAALDAATGRATFWKPKADFGVASIAIAGGTVVSGGSLGPGGKLRRNAAAFDSRTGRPLDWAPQVGGTTRFNNGQFGGVRAIAVSRQAVYLGGLFTTVNGELRNHLAAVSPSTADLLPWNPSADGVVEVLAAYRNLIYVGGQFDSVGGANRTNLAIVTSSGRVTKWSAGANDKVSAMARQSGVIYLGGSFTRVAGGDRKRLAALNAATGRLLPWSPEAADEVSSIVVAGPRVYVGGVFTNVGSEFHRYIAAVKRADGAALCWNPEIRMLSGDTLRAGAVNAVAVGNGAVHAGGRFNSVVGESRNRLAALVSECPAAATAWNPDLDGDVRALTAAPGTLFAGGVFRSVGGRYRPNLAVFAPEGAPRITAQPGSRSVAVGESVTFTSAAAGREPLTYQWQLNGQDIPGANGPELTLPSVEDAAAGEYVLVVTNQLGLVNSRSAALEITQPLIINADPQSQSVEPGAQVVLTVAADGHPAPLYQWRLNGVNIPGAVDPTYTIANATPRDGGSYDVVVANSVSGLISDAAILIVSAPAVDLPDDMSSAIPISGSDGQISGDNVGATAEPGETHAGKPGGSSVWLSWTAPAAGVGVFNTRGSVFDTVLGVYAFTNGVLAEVASDDDAGGFNTSQAVFNTLAGTNYLIAIDGVGGATGHIALAWTFEAGAPEVPRFVTQPTDQSVFAGSQVTFLSKAISAGVSYQWFKNCEAIPGAINANLTLTNVTYDDVANYHVIAINASSRVAESQTASLEIGPVSTAVTHDKLEDLLAAADLDQAATARIRAKTSLGATAFIPVPAGRIASQRLNNARASTQFGEPLICGVLGGASKWFGLRAKSSGTMTLDTIGSSIDTLLAAYRRVRLLSLHNNILDCDNDSAPDHRSSVVSFAVTNGQDIIVCIDGVNGQQGKIVLNWTLAGTVASTASPFLPVELSENSGFRPGAVGGLRVHLSGDRIGIAIPGNAASDVILETSTNLMQWYPLRTNPPALGDIYIELPAKDTPRRFFRVR